MPDLVQDWQVYAHYAVLKRMLSKRGIDHAQHGPYKEAAQNGQLTTHGMVPIRMVSKKPVYNGNHGLYKGAIQKWAMDHALHGPL
jgi:hypothetical protein